MNHKFPILQVPDNYECIWEPSTGVINATKSVATLQALCRKYGVAMRDRAEVLDIQCGEKVVLTTKDGCYTCDRLAVCAGLYSL